MTKQRYRDPFTDDMFLIPQEVAQVPSTMNFSAEVAALAAAMFSESGIDRFQIANLMTNLTGKEVSKYMLDAWTSETRDAYNIPFYLVPAAESVCKSHALSAWLANKRGARLAVGKDALNAEYGKLKAIESDIKKRMQHIQKMMGDA